MARTERARPPIGAALGPCLLALCLGAAAAPAAAPARPATPTAVEWRGRWLLGQGAFHRQGRLCLRALDSERCALELRLPALPWLPRRQYLLRDGEALLSWALPGGVQELLSAEDAWGRRLRATPAASWAALLGGDGAALAATFTEPRPEAAGRWPALRGRLGGQAARLIQRGRRAWSLDWELPEGSLRCRWEAGRGGAPGWLRVRLPEGAWLRVALRGGERPGPRGLEWLFLTAPGNPPPGASF